jgi:CRISPR type III-B/RAMP module-associated protein Cmr3
MSERITLFFEPLDVLQFRDHRPSDAGYHTLAESRFPLPSVFLGCIRTALFRMLGADFNDGEYFGIQQDWARMLLGGKSKPGGLCPRGPLVVRRDENVVTPYLPPPLDLIAITPDERELPECEGTYAIQRFVELDGDAMRLHARDGALEPVQGQIPWSACEPKKRAKPVLLTPEGARRYLKAATSGGRTVELGNEHIIDQSELLRKESRVGVARDPVTMTAEDHMLYIQRPFRLRAGHGFAVDVAAGTDQARELIGDLDGAVLPLGGKGHRACVHVHAGSLLPADLDPGGADTAAHANGCVLWLLTPMPVRPGLPGWPQGMSGVAERAVSLGGLDMSTNKPKPLAPALPAGTVIRAHGMTPRDAMAALAGDIEDIHRRGLGLAVIRPL